LIQNTTNTKIVIFTDSLSAVQALANIKIKKSDTFINAILEASNNMHNNGNSLVIAWIPSHVGIPGNESADTAAKKGLDLPQRLDTSESPSINDCYSEISAFIDGEWQRNYEENKNIIAYKRLEPKVTRKLKITIAGRSLDRVMTRLRLGYCLTNQTLFNFKQISSPNCNHCEVEETIQHLITCQATNLSQGIPSTNPLQMISNVIHLEILARNIIASGRKI
jgi:hypothetical protein